MNILEARNSSRILTKHPSAKRKGFTLLELLASLCISIILAVAVSSLIGTTWRAYLAESQQSDVNLRARSLMAQFASDVQAASYVVSAGTTSYTVPSTTSTIPPSSYTGTISQNLVLQVPAASSTTGIIANTYDYIGLTWDSAAKKVTRTVVASASGNRTSGSSVVAMGGLYVKAPVVSGQNQFFQLHIATSAPTNPGSFYPAAGSAYPSINGSRVADIDEVVLNAIVQETVYNTTVSQTLTTSSKLRNWRQT